MIPNKNWVSYSLSLTLFCRHIIEIEYYCSGGIECDNSNKKTMCLEYKS